MTVWKHCLLPLGKRPAVPVRWSMTAGCRQAAGLSHWLSWFSTGRCFFHFEMSLKWLQCHFGLITNFRRGNFHTHVIWCPYCKSTVVAMQNGWLQSAIITSNSVLFFYMPDFSMASYGYSFLIYRLYSYLTCVVNMLTSTLTYFTVADISWRLQKMNPHRQKSTSKNRNGKLGEQKKDACLFGSKLQTTTRVDADAKKSCQQALASVWLSLSQPHLQNTLLDSRHGAARDSDGGGGRVLKKDEPFCNLSAGSSVNKSCHQI